MTMTSTAWRAHPMTAYVVPTPALAPSTDLTVVGERTINGQAVDVVDGEDNTVQMLRFVLGPDTWLVASPDKPTVGGALVGALLG